MYEPGCDGRRLMYLIIGLCLGARSACFTVFQLVVGIVMVAETVLIYLKKTR